MIDKTEQQLKQTADTVKKLEKIVNVLYKQVQTLVKENVRLRANAHKMQNEISQLKLRVRNNNE